MLYNATVGNIEFKTCMHVSVPLNEAKGSGGTDINIIYVHAKNLVVKMHTYTVKSEPPHC